MDLRPLLLGLASLAVGCSACGGRKEPAAAALGPSAPDAGAVPPSPPAPASHVVHASNVTFRNRDVTLSGVLYETQEETHDTNGGAPGSRPAVVFLHGCGGVIDGHGIVAARQLDWAKRLAADRFVVLVTDSFHPRGVDSICNIPVATRPVDPWKDRVGDAYASLDFLANRKDVDARNVFVMGWSDGGTTAMGAVRPDATADRPPAAPRFKGAIAFYPACKRALDDTSYHPNLPLLLLLGGADDWNPPSVCLKVQQRAAAAALPMTTIAYPGAYHGFDEPAGEARVLPNVLNMASPTGKGAHYGRDQAAREKSIEDVGQFLRTSRAGP